MLLQFVYQSTSYVDFGPTLVKAFYPNFGRAISSNALRFASLATCAVALGRLSERYFQLALHSLALRVRDPFVIDEADLFATYLLAHLVNSSSWSRLLQNGYRKIAKHLSQAKSLQLILSWLGPFALDAFDFSISDRDCIRSKDNLDQINWRSAAYILRYGRFSALVASYAATVHHFFDTGAGLSSELKTSSPASFRGSNDAEGPSSVGQFLVVHTSATNVEKLKSSLFWGLPIAWAIQTLFSERNDQFDHSLELAILNLALADKCMSFPLIRFVPSQHLPAVMAAYDNRPESFQCPVPPPFAQSYIRDMFERVFDRHISPKRPGTTLEDVSFCDSLDASGLINRKWLCINFYSVDTLIDIWDPHKVYAVKLLFSWGEWSGFNKNSIAMIGLLDGNILQHVRIDNVGQIAVDYWGKFGSAVLSAVIQLLEKHKAKVHLRLNSRSNIILRTLTDGISMIGHVNHSEWEELVSCLKWIFSILSADTPLKLRTRRFVVDSNCTSGIAYIRESDPTILALCSCWLSLVTGANIGAYENYSTADSKPGPCSWVGEGLKIPFDILVHIAGVDEVVEVDGTPMLCGFQTALVPIALLPDGSVQWHVITAKDCTLFRWFSDRDNLQQYLPTERLHNVYITDLIGTAYVGGWRTIRVILGSNDPPNPIPRSCLPQSKHRHIPSGFDAGVAIQLQFPIIPIGIMGSVTKKFDLVGLQCRHTPSEDMYGVIDELYSAEVIVYDDAAKTAFMCQLVNLIFSLVRAYLRDNKYHYDATLLHFPSGVENSQAQVRELLGKQVDSRLEFRFEDVVRIVAKRYSRMNGTLRPEHRCTKSIIHGFEVADILVNNRTFYPRRLAVANGVEAWHALAEIADVVFCGAYGDIILGHDRLHCSQRAPPGCNILVCPLRLLKRHFDHMENNCYKQHGHDKPTWVCTGTPFDCGVMRIGAICDGWKCWPDRIQMIKANDKLLKRARRNSDSIAVVSFDDNGAIVFGCFNVLQRRYGIIKGTGNGVDVKS